MGNSISHRESHASGKVILSDGSVHEFNKPLTVAELMLEHPQQVVVEFHSPSAAAVAERRPTPLPADTKLDKKKIYLMLPMKGGKPLSLSSQEIHGVLLRANSVLRASSLLPMPSLGCLPPFRTRMCSAGDYAQAFVLPNKECSKTTSQGSRYVLEFDPPEDLDAARPEFLSRQLSGKATWKPNLDTIKEKKVEKQVSHWLF